MDKELADAIYKLARSFVEWKDLSEMPVPQMEEVSMAWKRLMGAEADVRRLDPELDDPEPCEDCPDKD